MNSYSISSNDTFSDLSDENGKPDDVYVFVKFLGEGAFGKVNLYQNTTDNNLVVWKEINLKRLNAKMRNEAFSEVEILSMLDHPNIITYFKHFIGEDILYIELEYAKSGNLTNLIKQQKNTGENFDQETVIWYFYQLTSAICYIHMMGIMHRDIKTLNIFIMHSGILKLGDFGISKILINDNKFAESVVGTPLYMSPEIIEGNKYSFSSDIWSLGCVMFEILTLSRVFEATNQLKLALKIISFDVNELSMDEYDVELKNLVKKILSKEPDSRPTAKEILNEEMFASRQDSFKAKLETLNLISKRSRNLSSYLLSNEICMNTNNQNAIIASKLSEVYQWGAGKLLPKSIDFFKNNKAPYQLSLGPNHFAVITLERELHTWAASYGNTKLNHAKLGLGKHYGFTRVPKKVDLNEVIKQVECGSDFTCVLDENGNVFSFGTDYLGCLGLGDELSNELFDTEYSIYDPIKIPFFEMNSLKVNKIACGESHVIALVECNDRDRIFTWGCGEHGRLGHGDENDINTPKEINFQINYKFKNIFAGTDCSFLITREGKVLAFGNNEYNKLLLNPKQIGFRNSDLEKSFKETSDISNQLVPKLIKNLSPYNIVKISSGTNHSAAIDVFGRLLTFGSNKFGQLGVGDSKPRSGQNLISGILSGQNVINVSCGDFYTLCCTSENQIFSWGNYKDGRLGLDSFLESNVLSPKPIFGSLLHVSEICSNNWTTMIIAEKMLNAKPVRSISLANYISKKIESNNSPLPELDSNNYEIEREESEIEQEKESNTKPVRFDLNNNNNNEPNTSPESMNSNEYSVMPDWLKKDLDEASFIPLEALEKKEIKFNWDLIIDKNNNNENNELKKLKREIELLKQENNQLRKENEQLKIQLLNKNNS